MRIAIMQPTYLPWVGYFELMVASGHFVYFDDVQFHPKSWHHRNRIKGPNGELWLSVPVLQKGSRFQKISEALIDPNQPWQRKHLRSIESAYQKSRYFQDYIGGFRSLYEKPWTKLVDLNVALLEHLRGLLGIATPTLLSSSLGISEGGVEKILKIGQRLGATELYDAAGAAEIIDTKILERAGIQVTFQNYRHPQYPQVYPGFMPQLSVVDLLFNEGPKSLEIIRSGALCAAKT